MKAQIRNQNSPIVIHRPSTPRVISRQPATGKALTSFAAVLWLVFFNTNVQAQGGGGLWQTNGPDIVYTNRFVGLGLNNPSQRFEMLGGFLLHGNAYIDSLLTATEVIAGSVTTGNLLVTGNSQLNGLLNLGSNLLIDGTGSSVTSSSGFLGFGNNNLTTTGNISAGSIIAAHFTATKIFADTIDVGQYLLNGLPLVQSQWVSSGNNIYYTGGNIGIGTTTPGVSLDVQSNSSVEIKAHSTGQWAGYSLKTGTSQTNYLWQEFNENKLRFWVNNADRMVIDDAGRVGIGTVTPSFLLEVQGDAAVKGTFYADNVAAQKSVSIGQFRFINGAVQPGQADSIRTSSGLVVEAKEQLKLTSQQEIILLAADTVIAKELVGIGRTPEVALDVAGDIRSTGTITANNLNVDTANFTRLVTRRIVSPDSIISIGDNSINFNDTWNRIYGDAIGVIRGLGLGDLTFPIGLNSTAIGYRVTTKSNAVNSIVIGSGSPNLSNGISNSLMVGFSSNIPTLFVGPSSGSGTTGRVGIGTTSPAKKLHVKTTHGIPIPPCPNPPCPVQTTPEVSSHMGIRLEDEDLATSAKSIWDLSPVGKTGKLHIGNLNDTVVTMSEEGNLGIGTTNPVAKLHLEDGSVLFSGTTGSTPISGAGARLMWIPSKRAFRVGEVTSSQWDDSNIGFRSVAMGYNAIASGHPSFAIGFNAKASGNNSLALGSSWARGGNSVAIGNNSVSISPYSIAIGTSAIADSVNSIAIGMFVRADRPVSHVIGRGVSFTNTLSNNIPFSLMIGYGSDIPTLFVGPSSGVGTTGSVGIGTTTVQNILHLHRQGDTSVYTYFTNEHTETTGNGQGFRIGMSAFGHAELRSHHPEGAIKFYTTDASDNFTEKMRITDDGRVGIGETNPQAKLHIEVANDNDKVFLVSKNGTNNVRITGDGRVFARKFRATLDNIPDYVFNDDYPLMSITQFGKFIYKNRHLPGFKSAKEVKENGGIVDLGERTNQFHELLEIYGRYFVVIDKRVAKLEKQNNFKDNIIKEKDKKIIKLEKQNDLLKKRNKRSKRRTRVGFIEIHF